MFRKRNLFAALALMAHMIFLSSTPALGSSINVVKNPGFEAGKAKWTASGGAFAIVTAGDDLSGSGAATASWNPSGAAQTLTSSLSTVPRAFLGKMCSASMLYKGGDANISMRAVNASAVVLATLTLTTSSEFSDASVEFTCPESGSVSFQLVSAADAAPIYIDDVSIGFGDRVRGPNVSGWESFTPTGSWVTNTTYTGMRKRNTDTTDYQIKISVSGAPTSAALTLTLPDAIETSKLPSAVDSTASVLPGSAVGIRDTGTNSYSGQVVFRDASTVAVHWLDDAASGVVVGGAVTQASPFTFAAGDQIFVSFSVPTANQSASAYLSGSEGLLYLSHDGVGQITGENGSLVPNQAAAANVTQRALTITQRPGYKVRALYNPAGLGWVEAAGIYPFASGNNSSATNFYGIRTVWTAADTLTVEFGNRGTRVAASNADDGAEAWSARYSAGDRWVVLYGTPAALAGFNLATTTNTTGLLQVGAIPADATGVQAGIGYVGKFLTGLGQGQTPTGSLTVNTGASVTLTPGRWLVFGYAYQTTTGTAAYFRAHIGKTHESSWPTIQIPIASNSNCGGAIPTQMVHVTGGNETWSVYIMGDGASSVASGNIYAMRLP